MSSEPTTWAAVAAILRVLILRCCRTEQEQWEVPAPQAWTAAREAELDRWIKQDLGPAMQRSLPIPPEIRWGLLQRARAAGSLAASAAAHQMPLPPVSEAKLLGILLLKSAKQVAELPPLDLPPWLE